MDFIELIQSFGFPIAACVILIAAIRELMKFLAAQYERIISDNKERESKYINIYTEANKRNDELIKTNNSFVSVLTDMQKSINLVESNVDDIKDYFELNKRNTDDRSET